MSRAPTGVVGRSIEAIICPLQTGVLITKWITMEVWLTATLPHMIATAVHLAFLRCVLGIVVVDGEEGLSVHAHADA